MSATPLYVRLPNWVGDVCMALPALQLLASTGVPIHACGRGWAVDLLAGMPFTTSVLPKSMAEQVRHLSRIGAQRGLLLTNSFGSALSCRLAGIEPIGIARDGRSWLLGVPIPRRSHLHEVEQFWRLAWRLSAQDGGWPVESRRRRWPRPPSRLGLQLADQHRAMAAQALVDAGIGGRFVVIAPLAVGTSGGRSKVWPEFPALTTWLHERGVAMVACPGPGEEAAMAAMVPQVRLLPRLGLGAYAAVCARARMVVANDSGPMHLAAAVDAPVLGLFGVSDPVRTKPWGLRARTLGNAQNWPDLVTVQSALVASVE
jgi:heptosyltransferase II